MFIVPFVLLTATTTVAAGVLIACLLDKLAVLSATPVTLVRLQVAIIVAG